MKKVGLWLFCGCLCVVSTWKIYDKLVDGFYLYRTFPPAHSSLPQSSHLIQSFADLRERLEQPFTYLASGSQSFVFVSEDHTLVLKLFKHYRWKSFSYLPWKTKSLTKPSSKQQEGVIATYQSSLFCMEELQEETGLLYLQLQPTNSPLATVTIHNRLGKHYLLPLHSTSFALQRYAEPVTVHLLKLKHLQKHEMAKNHLEKLFHYLVQRRARGFTDKDPNFLNNFGFVEEEPISIDIGGLIKDPKKDIHYFCSKELKKISKTLLPWLHKNYPELSSSAIKLIEEMQHIAQQET